MLTVGRYVDTTGIGRYKVGTDQKQLYLDGMISYQE